jgi:hypothetical protein
VGNAGIKVTQSQTVSGVKSSVRIPHETIQLTVCEPLRLLDGSPVV